MAGVEYQVGQQTQRSAQDAVEQQAEGSFNGPLHLPPFHNRKVPWHQPIGLLNRMHQQSDTSNVMTAEFKALRGQLDVFLQAVAFKIDDFGLHHEPQRSSSEVVIPLESLSDLKFLIEETATNYEAKLDQLEKNTKVQTQQSQRSIEKLAATYEASSKKVDDDYEGLAHGLNPLSTENETIADLVEKSNKDQITELQKLAHNQVQHEERLQAEFVTVRSELSIIKSAVKDLHDQIHKKGPNDEAQELRRRQVEQYDRVAKLKDDLVAQYRLDNEQDLERVLVYLTSPY